MYISIDDFGLINEGNSLDLNKALTGEQTVLNTVIDIQPSLEPLAERYTKAIVDGKDYYDLYATSNFIMNPKIAIAVYNNPWVGALDNGSDWTTLRHNKPKATYVDLHLKLDERLEVSDQITAVFKSYNFRPLYVMALVDANENPIPDGTARNLLIDPPEHILNNIKKDNPETSFTFNTYLTNTAGEKVRLYEYVLRCRIRVGYDSFGNKISATPEQIMSDMSWNFIQNDNSYVRIKAEDANAIANDEADPIIISGLVKGSAKTIPPTEIEEVNSNIVKIDFRLPLTKTVTFDKNTEQYGDTESQSHATVELKETEMTVGGNMPENPTFEKDGKIYTFKGWNTKADGTGEVFTGTTEVTEDIIVYAIWEGIYKATHTFVSGTVGKDLPDEVKVLLPMDKEGLADGAVVTPAVINQTTVTVADGTWTFDGWNPEEATINKADVNFVGTWTFTKKDTPPIPKHPKVIFDKNTTQYGDSSNQIHAVVALGANENTVGDKMPGNPNYSDYEFIGWNTKADGTGFVFTKDTIVDRDITVYAQWKLKVKPEVKPDYNPSIPFIFDYNHYFETVLKSDRHFKYMFGYPNGTFLPNGNMTRAEATAMFNRILFNGVDSDYVYDGEFTDINPNDWYAKVVGYMTKYGFIKGYPDGSFKPNQPITRAEFASIAAKVSQVENAGAGSFTDVDSNYWAYGDINKLVREGWIEGYEDGTFKPENEITRSESVTIANKMQIRYPDKEYIDAKKALLESYTDLDETHWAYYQIMEAGNGHEFERLGNGKDERWKVLIDLGDIMNTK